MKSRACLLLLSFGILLQAQMQMNVQQLADFIRSELALRQHSDKQIGAYVRKIQLSEKLTDKTIIDLQAQGAGPKTVEALQALRDESANLKPSGHDATYSPATAPDNTLSSVPPTATLSNNTAPVIPPPDSVRQQQILDAMKQYALNYTQNLPNFMCVEVTRQYVDPNAGDHYRSLGSILARVGYHEGREEYKVYSIHGRLVDTDMEGVKEGGAISTGEFGSLMREIFEPKSEAEFGWDHWATLRGRRMAVFNYFIDSGHSNWSIRYGSGGDEQRIITAYKGTVYADADTGEIDRIKFVAVDIPKTFPVSETTEILDYDLTDISGQKFVCPMMARLFMKAGRDSTKNEIEFRNYRKFGVETDIKYDMDTAAQPLPESKTQEQPAAAANTANPQTSQPNQTPGSKTANKSTSGSNPWSLPTPPPPPPQ